MDKTIATLEALAKKIHEEKARETKLKSITNKQPKNVSKKTKATM